MRNIARYLLPVALVLLVACGTPTPSASDTTTDTFGFSQTPVAGEALEPAPAAEPVETVAPPAEELVPTEAPAAVEAPAGDQAAVAARNDSYSAPPEMAIDQTKSYLATIETTKGTMKAELYASEAPITVNNFVSLARDGYFNGIRFHRIINGFMVQTGDPLGTGTGGPGYSFEDESVTRDYVRGTLAMANAGPNTNGSQFFIVHADYPLDKNYTIFGKVVEGLETLDAIASVPVSADPMSGEPSVPTEEVLITGITIEEQ